MLDEKSFIKNKVTSLVVEIAKREWPQRWPNLLEQLIDVSKLGEAQAELIFLILRTLPEEIMVYNTDLTELRKKNLTDGITAVLSTLFPFFYSVLETTFTAYKTAQQQAAEAQLSSASKLIVAVLNTLLAFVEWVPVSYVFNYNFLPVFCSLLYEPALRMVPIGHHEPLFDIHSNALSTL